MTTACGRADCPVAQPTSHIKDLKAAVMPAGARLFRGVPSQYDAADLVPGLGNTRFAPLADTHHVYVSRTATAALLESALHHLTGPEPTIWKTELGRWSLGEVTLESDVRLGDLRDPELTRMGVARDALVDTSPFHYRCTRRWAEALQHHMIDGAPIHGLLWHSRQADIHARANAGGLLGDLLTHRQIEVAVLWHPNGPKQPLGRPAQNVRPLVTRDGVDRLMLELSALLRVPIE